jgi:hypothetical protein
MIVEVGEKLHVIYRALYEDSARRHFLGEVLAAEGAVCRLEGYVFIYDKKSTMFERRPEKRLTIIDVAESGYIVNVVDRSVALENVVYSYVKDVGLVATDRQKFSLNINEFGNKS